MDSYKSSCLGLQDQDFQPSEGQTGGWSLQQHDDYRPGIDCTETSRNVYPETSSNGRSLITHNGYLTVPVTRPPYSYPSPNIPRPNTPNEYAESQMVIARTSSSSSLMSTSESYGSPDRRLDWHLQLQQPPVAYQPFLDDFGPVTHERCIKTVQEMPASSYQETTGRPSSHNSATENWPVQASHSTPTHSTHKVLNQGILSTVEELKIKLHSRDSPQAQDNTAKSTLKVVDGNLFTQALRARNQAISFELDGEPHNNVSESIGEITEEDLKGMINIDPSTIDVTCMMQLNPAGQLNNPINQAQSILLQNGGSTSLMQPMKQPSHSERHSFPSQSCAHRGHCDNRPPDRIVPQVSTPILLMDWQQFRTQLKDGYFSSVLSEIATNSTSRKNFAAVLNRRVFSEEERKLSNVSGTKGKKKLDPDWIGIIKETVFRYWPFEPGKPKINAWRECIKAIDTANRQLKHR